ncbi:MAG TPA: HAD family hydrolase [Dehalococcoidia bacterium]|jgi:Cof subfamily protein (haloacid dehalogenase superfamily)|nr:HAD family hydrolase [Dehalococcoidia bacterium]
MLPQIKVIATDLDGTLLRSDGTLSLRTLAALRAASAVGLHIAIATARPLRALRPVLRDEAFDGWGVCQNGAVVYELSSYERVLAWEMERAVAARIVEELRRVVGGVSFAIEMDDLFHCEPHFESGLQALEPPEVRYGDALELICGPLTKLLAHHPSFAAHELASAAAGIVGADGVVTHSGARFIEISASGVTKAFAVSALCERLDVEASEVVAFGDMPNDLAMMRWAGHSVAVANAHPDVKACASAITASNDDDGVASVIERLVEL